MMIEINDFYGEFKTKKEIDDELDNMPTIYKTICMHVWKTSTYE